MNRLINLTIFAVIGLFVSANVAAAAPLAMGETFSVANDGAGSTGDHFHSNNGGIFGNPTDAAEVGDFFSEDVRGMSEFDISALPGGYTSATLDFKVFNDGGLFSGSNDFPFVGDINIFYYAGNNAEDLSDYEIATNGLVATFSTVGLSVGDDLSFDVTAILNGAIGMLTSSLGFRLQVADGTNPQGGAWTFDTFKLNGETEVPEPATAGLLLMGIAGAALLRKRQDA